MVTLSIETVTFVSGDTGWSTLLALPAGYRPRFILRKNLISAGSATGHQIAVYANGTVSNNRDPAYTLRDVFTYPTTDAWPTALPGSAA